MRKGVTNRKHMLYACVTFVTIVLGMQLVAATAWTADMANSGPCITIIQLSQDPDSDWATNDLVTRLSEFIHDDSFIKNRIEVIKTNDPYVAESITDRIIIYVSHGGPIGIVTGDRLTSWRTMAEIVTESKGIMHLFTSCYSRNIIRYGDSTSGEKLYTVPGARPAEVTNVEITSSIMLALGLDTNYVEGYRTSELTVAKELIESEESVHIMDFEQIILTEIEAIDDNYEDSYTDTHRVYRFTEEDTLTGIYGYSDLPYEIRYQISLYFGSYLDDDLVPVSLTFISCTVSYIRNYYYEAEWIVDYPDPDPDDPPYPDPDDPPIREPGDPPIGPESVSLFYMAAADATSGHWEYGPNIFCGGTYSGFASFGFFVGYNPYQLTINITASGPTIDAYGETEIDSYSLRAIAPKGTYVMNQKVDGVWSDPVVGRDPARTGGLWTDSATRVDYEYEPNILPIPHPSSTGILSCNGEYFTFTSIPAGGTDWHGPTYIKTLPSYFKLSDLGSFSANLSLVHGINGLGKGQTLVSLYDEDMKIVLALAVTDIWDIETGGDKQYFSVIHYKADGTCTSVSTDTFSGEMSGIETARYDPQVGLWARGPGDDHEHLVLTHNLLNKDRLIKYVGMSSYRYAWRPEHDERIYSIRLSYAGSEYTVFHDDCNDLYNFNPNSDFGYGNVVNGTFEIPSGASYLTLGDIDPCSSTTSYRKSHLLNGASGAGTNYQIQITAHYSSGTDGGKDVYLNSHAKTDFSDVRFLSSDGATQLSYWCESVVVGNYAKFWVKISDNLDYDQTIYIDYGNEEATSTSNGAATFIAFDDFEDYSAGMIPKTENGWDAIDDVYIQNNPGGRSGLGLKLDTSLTTNSEGVSNDWGAIGADSIAIHYMWYCSRVVDRNGYTSIVGYQGNTATTAVTTLWNGQGTDSRDWYNGAYYTEYSPQFTYAAGTWYEIEDHLSYSYYHSMKNGVDLSAGVRSTGVDDFYRFSISTYQDNRHGDWYTQYDDFFVRKWIASEPTHGVWGVEEGTAGWHGPNYVHVLDRPFRLFQLSEFSVLAELIQGTSSLMGKTGVALYDDNKQCIMTVEWIIDYYGTVPVLVYWM